MKGVLRDHLGVSPEAALESKVFPESAAARAAGGLMRG